MKVEHTGWIIVNTNANDFILEWSFRFYRKDAIRAVIKNSGKTWEELRKRGMKCLKAKKTISTIVTT